jgi:hypothetical protein
MTPEERAVHIRMRQHLALLEINRLVWHADGSHVIHGPSVSVWIERWVQFGLGTREEMPES